MVTTPLDPLYEALDLGLKGDAAEMAKSASPLCLAMSLAPGQVMAYPHTRLVDSYLVALCNLQLYPDGPGPEPNVFVRHQEGEGEWIFAGTGLNVALSPEVFSADEKIYIRPGHAPDIGTEHHIVLNLALVEPPRHGKSFLATEHLPLWFLVRYPTAAILLATYSSDFAEKWGAALKDKLATQGRRLPVASDRMRLKPLTSTNASTSFRPGKDRGEINYRGVGGSITGTGFNLGIIDDPFKDATEALSDAERKIKQNWYTAVFSNRPTPVLGLPPPIQVMMATRWHENDLIGAFALSEDNETAAPGWCVLRIPAIAEAGDSDPLGRPEGASLCPQMASKAFLEKQQADDPVWFSCLYQGSPIHTKSGFFRRTYEATPGHPSTFHHYRYDPVNRRYDGPGSQIVSAVDEACVHFAIMDVANSKRTSADWTVISNWAFDPWTNTLILVDRFRDRVNTDEYVDAIEGFYELQRPEAEPLLLGVEDKTFGTSLINDLRRDRPGWVVVPLKAEYDKISRNTPYAKGVAAGRVWFPDPLLVPWAVNWENEHSNFWRGTYDDQVDCGGYAYLHSRTYLRPGEKRPGDEPESLPEPTHVQKGMAIVRRRNGISTHPYTELLNRVQPGGM